MVGLLAAALIWWGTARMPRSLARSIVVWTSALSAGGFAVGFIGVPAVALLMGLNPGLAPLWGLILGPVGAVLGALQGAAGWWLNRKRR